LFVVLNNLKLVMRIPGNIKYYVQRLFLHKLLYYSVLYLIISALLLLIIVFTNYVFFPPLEEFIKGIKAIAILWGLGLLFGPIRLLGYYLATFILPITYFSKALQKYDEGRWFRSVQFIQSKNTIENWASKKVLEELNDDLPRIEQSWRSKFALLPIMIILILSITCIAIFKSPVSDTGIEITTSEFTSRSGIQFEGYDTIHMNYGEVFTIPEISKTIVSIDGKLSQIPSLICTSDIELTWLLQGRLVKSLWIATDSIPRLNSYTARITPPAYLEVDQYTSSDTLFLYDGSEVFFELTGLLTDRIFLSVSRGTVQASETINWSSGETISIVSSQGKELVKPVIIELKDHPPTLTIIQNSIDSLEFEVRDDFGLHSLFVNNHVSRISGSRKNFNMNWSNTSSVEIKVRDTKGQTTVLTVEKPMPSAQMLQSQIASQVADELGIRKESKERLSSAQHQKEKTSQDRKEDEIKKLDPLKPLTPEEESKWTKELNQLWLKEQLLTTLYTVDSNKNASTDSLIAELLEDITTEEGSEEADVLDQIEDIPEQGEEREEEAKDAAKKLEELLNTTQAAVQEDNVERLKRLLKQSWSTSIQQEITNTIALETNKVRQQKALLAIEDNINDSLAFLLVHDPALAMALTSCQNNLEDQISVLERAFVANKGVPSASGYVLSALNELDMILYEILESEKLSLNQAQKNCKNGRPGKTGKPSTSGQGQKGNKGKPSQGKKPGGRSKGQSGELREEGENGQKGASGKGTPQSDVDLLKRIESMEKMGVSKELQSQLESIKQQLLFMSNEEKERLEAFEKRLWSIEQSVFEKEEIGDTRSSKEGNQKQEESVDFKVNERVKSSTTDLPLPILKRK